MGHHLLYILRNPHRSNLTSVLKMQYAIEMTWNICTYVVKLANILLLARLFGHSSTHFRMYLHITHAFLLLWTTASFFGAVFRCSPIESFWDLSIHGSCPHVRVGKIIPQTLNSFTDMILLYLPMRPVWHLILPLRQRLAVIGIFCVGFFCLATSATRLNYYIVIPQSDSHDHTCKHPLCAAYVSAYGTLLIQQGS